MKKINISLFGATAAVCFAALSGCVEETFPQSKTATDELVASSPAAAANMAAGMPASALTVWSDDSHFSFGIPAIMMVREMMCGDLYFGGDTGYSGHFISWQRNKYQGDGYLKTQFTWNFYYTKFLLGVNQLIGAINPQNAIDEQLGYLGEAYAFRAMIYLDLARMYEFLPNDVYSGKNTDGNDVTNLTVPWVSDKTTPSEATNNPRVPRAEMAKHIEDDLNLAEEYVVYQSTNSGGLQPDLACVYGLKARLYMWIEDYEQAAVYADKAIKATSVKPITKNVALDVTSGYNQANQFMWAMQQTSSNYCVQTAIINWISWASNQSTFGYTGAGTGMFTVMDKKMYERISDTDWRKLQWFAPAGSALEGQNIIIESSEEIDYADYTSLKFRPGNGDADDNNVGAATAVPFMRVEEMYYIKAEALAQTGKASDALATLKEIMITRDADYAFSSTEQIALVDEIIFQKRVELWGEGQTFFDIKRLNMSVTRGYKGTNCSDANSKLNTVGRPAWMNFVMVRTESNNNKGLEGWNNPDPSDQYTPWTDK